MTALWQRLIIHVDMDAFFASVEELYQPDLRGKPLIVGSDPKDGRGRGVVSTANYEARKYGIHSAMPISKAFRLCPQGIYLRPGFARYAEKSREVMEILNCFSPLVQQVSIDEAFLDCTGCEKLFGTAEQIGFSIKHKIQTQTGLTASIGIAANKSLAKIASDYNKPDGITLVEPGKEKEFLHPLPINKLWGIGKKTQVYLNSLGIYYVRDIIPRAELLEQKMGRHGVHIWNMANGIDFRPVVSNLTDSTKRKSISKERTFDEDTADRGRCEHALILIADDIAAHLRRQRLAGTTVSIKVRLDDFTTFSRSRTMEYPFNQTRKIQEIALDLFRGFDNKKKKYRLIGLHISNLASEEKMQPSLFDGGGDREKKVDRLMDAIKDKFGKNSIKRAIMIEPASHEKK